MKKALTLVLALSLLLGGASALAEESWLAPYEETVHVTFGRYGSVTDPAFPEGEAIDNSKYTQWLKEQFNISFSVGWMIPSDEINEKISLNMATDSLPDIFIIRDKIQLQQLIQGGMVADLTEVVDTYASDLMRGIYESYGGMDAFFSQNVRGEDGRIYAITATAPGYEFILTWVRQDWLDALGLEKPATWAELEQVAHAFIQNKLGGEHTVGIEIGNSLDDTYCTAGSPGPWYHNFGAYPGNWLEEEGTGKYVYGSVQPQMKDALAYMRGLFAEGLIDYEFATKDWVGSIAAGNTGITFGAWWIGAWPLANSKANDPKAQWVPLWIKGDNGQYNPYQPDIDTESYFWAVSSKCAHPEVLMKMVNIAAEQQNLFGIAEYDEFPKHIPVEIDTFYSDIGYKFDYHAWPIDIKMRDYNQLLKLEPVWMALVDKVKNGEEIPEFATESFDGKKIVAYMNGEDQSSVGLHVYAKTLALQLLAENQDSLVEKPIYVPKVTPTMEFSWSNLKDLEAQTFMKIIMGELPLDAFDTFVADWQAQGGSMITGEVNAAAGK